MNRHDMLLKAPARPLRSLWIGAMLAFCGALWLGIASVRAHQQASDAERFAVALKAGQKIKPVPKKSRSELDTDKRWGELSKERSFPWNRVMHAIEQSASEDIDLFEFAPDRANFQVYLRGEARDRAALLQFLGALEAQPLFVHVHLSHQENKELNRLRTVVFEVKASVSL